jgi:predicted nucleic-acid-binding protein
LSEVRLREDQLRRGEAGSGWALVAGADGGIAAALSRLIEGSLSAESRGFISIMSLAEIVWVMSSNYRATRTVVADIVEGLLTAPQLTLEKADVVWRSLRAYRNSKADFSDAVIVELARDAGCSKTVTFDRDAATHPGHPGFEGFVEDTGGCKRSVRSQTSLAST